MAEEEEEEEEEQQGALGARCDNMVETKTARRALRCGLATSTAA